ncbi:MAG: alkaline shock response membrane anchor protein AmaP [Candidatus Spyradocola sp.]|jgi:hypothetical protein
MKMKWYDRLLAAVSALVLLAAAVFAVGAALGPFRAALQSMGEVSGLLLGLVGVVLALIALRVLYAALGHAAPVQQGQDSVLIKATENGSILIALSALDTMVQRSVRACAAVRDVESRLVATEQEGVRVLLRVSFAPDSILPEATAQIQRDVKEYIQSHAGVPVVDVQIFVEAVGAPQPVRVE